MYLATLEHQMSFDELAADTVSEIKTSLQKLSMIASQVKALNEVANPNESLNLSVCVKNEVEELQKNESISTKGIRLNLTVEAENICAPLSATEVTRILQNLVGNAADASNPGSNINVAVARKGSQSVLTVEDKGHGIPEHLHEKVFEPDFTSKPSTGTGLGLFIVKHICEQKRGTVSLQSLRGQGTKITVAIPETSAVGGLHAT
jgi:signal transduction histidine kinase